MSIEKLPFSASPEDGALLGLSTLGPGNYLKLPDMIVGKDGPQKAARSFDKELLDRLCNDGLVVFSRGLDGYGLSPNGAKRVMEILLVESEMAPIHALDALVTFGAAIGIQKAEGKQFMVNALIGGTAYVAMNKDLSEAIRIVKKKVDQTLIGS
jgi:hypothetical protein